MAWRPHGHAHVNPSSPRAFAICDRCNRLFNHEALSWQFIYAGPNLQNKRILVCESCLDIPNPQLKPRILPPDPVPIRNARPEIYTIDDSDWLVTQDGDFLTTQSGLRLVVQNSSNQRPPAT